MDVKKVAFWTAVAATLLVSAALIVYRLDEPLWEGGHQGYMMTEYPHNALNYLRFGYVGTKLGLVMDYGPVVPDDGFDCRTDHPILSALLISFVYHLFGVSDWGSRLAFVLITLGGSLATLLLAVSLLGNRWTALMALIFCALSPATIFYGRMPESHTIAVSGTMFVFLLYWLWFTTERWQYLVGLCVAFVLSANMDWIAYFAVPAILLHYLLAAERPSWRFVAGFAVLPFVLVAVYLAFAFAVKGVGAFDELWRTLLFRTLSVRESGTYAFTWRQFWNTFYERTDYWLTTPVPDSQRGLGAPVRCTGRAPAHDRAGWIDRKRCPFCRDVQPRVPQPGVHSRLRYGLPVRAGPGPCRGVNDGRDAASSSTRTCSRSRGSSLGMRASLWCSRSTCFDVSTRRNHRLSARTMSGAPSARRCPCLAPLSTQPVWERTTPGCERMS